MKLLNNNIEEDIMGLPPGTLKLAGRELSEFFSKFVLKKASLNRYFKRGDPNNRNYRGMGYLCSSLNTRTYTQCRGHSLTLLNTQSRLQKGFTPGCFKMNVVFILSQCILESAVNIQKAGFVPHYH